MPGRTLPSGRARPGRRRRWRLLLLLLLAAFSGPAVARATEPRPDRAAAPFLQYVDALKRGDWTLAAQQWCRADRDGADRLGLEYGGVPLKLDSASPLVGAAPALATGQARLRLLSVRRHRYGATVTARLRAGDDSVTLRYPVLHEDGRWRLRSPLRALMARSTRIELPWVRVFLSPGVDPDGESDGAVLNPVARRSLSAFVDSTLRNLALSPERIELLREAKLELLLCDATEIAALAGTTTEGVTNFQQDVVISRHPVHTHELAHLLFNFALGAEGPVPPYTLPALQEGVAVALGGRWGRTAPVVLSLGAFVLSQKLLEPEDLLSWEGFRANLADLSYAPAGVLVAYLMEQLGPGGFARLYRQCSGDLGQVQGMSREWVEGVLERAVGRPWPQIRRELLAYAAAMPPSGLAAAPPDGVEAEGTTDSARPLELSSGGLQVTLRRRGDWVELVARTEGGVPRGAVLWWTPVDELGTWSSELFHEQFPAQSYLGQRGSCRFSPRESGVYDYGTDLLTAKHVQEWSGGPPAYDAPHKTLRLRLDRRLLPAALTQLRLELVRE